jgi:2-methylisocitrate lyase-like PEP mutase family enzyme
VVKALDRPVNVLMGLQGVVLSRAELSTIGARRISVGSALYRAAMGEFLRAAHEMRDAGTFGFAADAASPRDIDKTFPI